MRKQKGFIPILITLIIAILGVIGYLKYRNYQSKTSPSDVASQPPQIADPRDCIANEQKVTIDQSFFVNKWYEESAASGYSAHFNPDGTTTESWGLDYAGPNDTRPNSGKGTWSFSNGKLVMYSSRDKGTFDVFGFRSFKYKDEIYTLPGEISMTVIIGSDPIKINDFFKNQIFPLQKADFKGCGK